MLAARAMAISALKKESGDENAHNSVFLPRLVAYCSQESHSSVEKAAMIALVDLRILPCDDDCRLDSITLKEAMEEDVAKGLVPFFISVTLGSTACTSFDKLDELGPVVKKYNNVWLHVDAAYAGSGFICPELRFLMKGIEHADSYNTNPNKWMLTAFDCSCLWVKDRIKLTKGLVVDPLYLQHANSDDTIDYRHWGIPLSRRFRSLKLWFVFRKYGISGLQAYIRNHIKLAKLFEAKVRKDKNFMVMNDVHLGLVCFRMVGSDKTNENFVNIIRDNGKLFLTPAMVKGKFTIRFCVVSETACEKDIDYAWEVMMETAALLATHDPKTPEPIGKPFFRQLSRQFSFTRSVSRDIYQRSQSRTSLHDGATPILVEEDEGLPNGVIDEEVFLSNHNNNNVNKDKSKEQH